MQEPTILVREGSDPRYPWRQYLVVTDGRVSVVHMLPALFGGWRFGKVDIQSDADWGRSSQSVIVEWIIRHHVDGYTKIAPELPADFREKLIARATAVSPVEGGCHA